LNFLNKFGSLSTRYKNLFLVADEHYSHKMTNRYSNRPFNSVTEMNEALINNHNNVVTDRDLTIHAGDFTFEKHIDKVEQLISSLNGTHIFLKGSHDYWQKSINKKYNIFFNQILEVQHSSKYIVICHYAMSRWPRSHYGSYLAFGHSHGHYTNQGKSWDVGVDNNNYFPVAIKKFIEIMEKLPENENNHK